MNEYQFPWLILVPRRTVIKEVYQLNEQDQSQLQIESSELGGTLMNEFEGDKLNIAALGNVVPQLHIHHIVRFQSDAVWPQPVWGNFEPQAYSEEQKTKLVSRLRQRLSLDTSAFQPC